MLGPIANDMKYRSCSKTLRIRIMLKIILAQFFFLA